MKAGRDKSANSFKTRSEELKPRERIEAAGTAEIASATELLAIILKTGTVGCDVMELARRLIDAFDSVEDLVRTDLGTLRSGIAKYNKDHPGRKIAGLGRVKSIELAAAFELARRGYANRALQREPIRTASMAASLFRTFIKDGAEKEMFFVLPLDTKMKPITAPQMVALGTVNEVGVHPRDVFSVAVRWNATAVMVAHNHPSGSAMPSKRDDNLTHILHGAGKTLFIPLIDHIIIGGEDIYSYAEAKRLEG